MIAILNAVLQFALHVNDPSWKCEVSHRDPGVAGTYYLYCSQWTADGVELIDVGRFIPDVPRHHKGRP
jgi:hypothetical protein